MRRTSTLFSGQSVIWYPCPHSPNSRKCIYSGPYSPLTPWYLIGHIDNDSSPRILNFPSLLISTGQPKHWLICLIRTSPIGRVAVWDLTRDNPSIGFYGDKIRDLFSFNLSESPSPQFSFCCPVICGKSSRYVRARVTITMDMFVPGTDEVF